MSAGCSTAPNARTVRPAAPTEVRAEHSGGNTTDDIGPLLAPIFQRAGIPGGAAMVLRGGHVIAQGAAGVRKAGADEAITMDDQFEICSCAKAMTATLVAWFVDEGRLAWNTPVADIFQEVIPNIDPAWKKITVQQLMEHRAGLQDHILLLARTLSEKGDPPAIRRHLVAQVLSRPPDAPAGQKYAYESTGYVMLGAILEKISDQTWEQLMRERLFAGLGIISGGFGPPGTAGDIRSNADQIAEKLIRLGAVAISCELM